MLALDDCNQRLGGSSLIDWQRLFSYANASEWWDGAAQFQPSV